MTTQKSPTITGQGRNQSINSMISQAERLAILYGLAVFPLQAGGKAPLTRHGFKDATKDPTEFTRLVAGRLCNLGIATGALSGVWVLDIDLRDDGNESVRKLQAAYGQLPKTWTVKTGGRGRHLYFKYDASHPVGCGTKLAGLAGLDWRGNGGYVVAPPSETESEYQWIQAPWDVPLASAPEGLLKLTLRHSQTAMRRGKVAPQPTGGTRQTELLQIASGVSKGDRNRAAAKIAGYLLSFRRMDPEFALVMIENWNLTNDPPLSLDELHKIVNSIAQRQANKEGVSHG